MRHRARLDHAARRRADVVIENLVRVEAVDLQHLGNDFVGAPGGGEVVHIIATQCRRQRGTYIGLGHAQRGDFFAVHHQLGLRFVDLQIHVGEPEQLLFLCLGHHRLRHFVEVFHRIGGGDHKLHRQPLGARQRGQREGGNGGARHLVPLLLQIQNQLGLGACALIPGFKQHAAQALVERGQAGELEHLRVFRLFIGDLEGLVGNPLHLLR